MPTIDKSDKPFTERECGTTSLAEPIARFAKAFAHKIVTTKKLFR